MSNPKELYIFNEMIVDQDYRLAHIMLIKVLFRLEIIDKDEAVRVMLKFTPIFV